LLLADWPNYNVSATYSQADTGTRFFPETNHFIKGRFRQYWEQNGGLPQQGYPISDEMLEVSGTDGKTYLVQYFERAVFELHPENQAPNDVLLSLLGVFEYKNKYAGGVQGQQPNAYPGSMLFPETGKRLGGKFLEYWRAHGGLPQQGYPISDEFQEVSALDGKTYTVQYFERAEFELHSENAGTPYEVLLSQLGTFRYVQEYRSLNIPPPPSGRRQAMPQGSETYLVWVEADPPEQRDENYDVFGVDLKNNRPITVTDAPGDQLFPSISGSLVVWVDTRHSCSTCDYDILGKDLATGREFSVATGPYDQSHPAIAGTRVAWVEGGGNAIRLLLKDLTEAGEPYEVQSFPLQNGTGSGQTFGLIAISEEYLVWSELGHSARSSQPYELRSMNLKTREVRSVFKGDLGYGLGYSNAFLSGHHLVHLTPRVELIDLSTGQSRTLSTLPASTATIQGDTVVWLEQSRLYGMRLNDPDARPRQLVQETLPPGDYATFMAIAGDWLVWSYSTGPRSGTLGAKRLNEAFSVGQGH
jgi:hypothetical protein